MRKLRALTIAAAVIATLPTLAAAQAGREFKDAWFWGVKVGGFTLADSGGRIVQAPIGRRRLADHTHAWRRVHGGLGGLLLAAHAHTAGSVSRRQRTFAPSRSRTFAGSTYWRWGSRESTSTGTRTAGRASRLARWRRRTPRACSRRSISLTFAQTVHPEQQGVLLADIHGRRAVPPPLLLDLRPARAQPDPADVPVVQREVVKLQLRSWIPVQHRKLDRQGILSRTSHTR